MSALDTDLVIVGAGPVGMMCAHLARLCGLRAIVLDRSDGPLQTGRADALNARSLQLLEVAGLFRDLYPLGKPCNTSAVWANGGFVSRQSSWWDELEGCLHKHFLMLGQSHLERLLDARLADQGTPVRRQTEVAGIELTEQGCLTLLKNGESLRSRYVIAADGSRSSVREQLRIPFELVRPQIVWAVVDGVIETDFPKVPEIIVFQAETSDVAWIPREGDLDRFYVRMDTRDFTQDDAIAKINRAMHPHTLKFAKIDWFSQFSVKESVAERFSVQDRVFLAGDAAHVHSVNGGQGLNTGLADAFNLIWKISQVVHFDAPAELLRSYESERKPVAISVVETSGELVRSTKFSVSGTHALDYVKIVQKRSGNVTGMGIRYGGSGLPGTRLFDFEVFDGSDSTRLYSLLDYSQYTLLLFGDGEAEIPLPRAVRAIRIHSDARSAGFWTANRDYAGQAVLVRPDSYIQGVAPLIERKR